MIAYPLAWLTTRVYLRPRGHVVADISASEALRRITVPVLLLHGSEDAVVPVAHLGRLQRVTEAAGHPAETLVIEGGQHSWLYEFPEYRRTVARFLARVLGGPLAPDDAATRAEVVDAHRLPDVPRPPTQIELEPGGFRSLVRRSSPVADPGPATDETNGASHPAGVVGTEIVG